jgi:hypothetical protein
MSEPFLIGIACLPLTVKESIEPENQIVRVPTGYLPAELERQVMELAWRSPDVLGLLVLRGQF